MNKGWQCPVCGRGNAPWKSECECYLTDYRRMNTGLTDSIAVNPNDVRYDDNRTAWSGNYPRFTYPISTADGDDKS